MRKIQIILVLALLFSQAALSATNEPNHPLSQINPIDQDFNLENHQILNLSMVRLNDGSGSTGLVIDDYTIRDSGNLNPLRLDTSNGKWVIDKSTDLDLTGSDVLDINEINPGGQALTLGGQTTLQGDIAMGSNNIDTSGLVDGVDLDNPGNAVIVDGSNRYAVAQNSIGNGELNNADSFTMSGLTMNGNINLNGYNMTGIDVLHFQSGMAINGSINTTGGDVNLGGGDIHDVGAIDGGGTPVTFNDEINLAANKIFFGENSQSIGDSGTELYFGDSSEMLLTTQGFNSGSMVTDGGTFVVNGSTNNVGVGTSNPGHKFDVRGGGFNIQNGNSYFRYNGAADVKLRYDARGSGGRAIVHGGSNTLVLNYNGDFSGGTQIGDRVKFAATTGDSYINTGQVGIGTSSPSEKLELSGDGTQSSAVLEFSNLADGASNTLIKTEDSTGTQGMRIRSAGGSQEYFYVTDENNNQYFTVNTANGRVVVNNGKLVLNGPGEADIGDANINHDGAPNQLTVDADTTVSDGMLTLKDNVEVPNGRVGIQTVGTPSRPLVVNGSSIFHGTLSMSNNAMDGVGAVRINDVGEGEGLDFGGGRVISVSTSGQGGEDAFEIQTDATYPVEIETRDANGAETDRLSVTTGVNQADIDVTNADIDLNGNSVTSSSGEVCIGDQCT